MVDFNRFSKLFANFKVKMQECFDNFLIKGFVIESIFVSIRNL